MRSPWACGAIVAVGFFLFAALQYGAARHLSILGATPDPLMAWAFTASLLMSPAGGAACGFVAGVLQGALAGANLTQYALARIATAFALGALAPSGDGFTVPIAAGLVALGTIVSRTALLFMAPQPDIAAYAGDTIGAAIYNGVLAAAMYAGLRPVFRPKGMSLT